LYDNRPGNGAGLFLQPRSPHGASGSQKSSRREFKISAVVFLQVKCPSDA